MGIPNQYLISGEPILANYDFTDILTGTAYETLYAGKTGEYTGYLRPFQFDSYSGNDGIYTTFTVETGADFVLKFDRDFDVEMGTNKTIEGQAIITGGVFFTGGATKGYAYQVDAIVREWDGTTETLIVSGSSALISGQTDASGEAQSTYNVDVDIPKTTIKKGNTLRLTIQLFNRSTDATLTGAVGHDPAGKEVDATYEGDSKLIFYAPFKIFF